MTLLRPSARVLCTALSLALAPGAHAVQQAKSRYTTIDLSQCSVTARKAWLCEGLPGYPIHVAVESMRTFLSVGRSGPTHPSAGQSLGPTNTLFDGRSRRAAVEWRFIIRDKKTVPYATIVRYFTRDQTHSGEVVIVTRVTETESCQVARIDALANKDAMVLARTIADRQARTFDCIQKPLIIGAIGNSPM